MLEQDSTSEKEVVQGTPTPAEKVKIADQNAGIGKE